MTQEETFKFLRDQYQRMLLSKKEAAKELNISWMTLDRLRKNGQISSKRVLGQVYFSIDEVARFIADA